MAQKWKGSRRLATQKKTAACGRGCRKLLTINQFRRKTVRPMPENDLFFLLKKLDGEEFAAFVAHVRRHLAPTDQRRLKFLGILETAFPKGQWARLSDASLALVLFNKKAPADTRLQNLRSEMLGLLKDFLVVRETVRRPYLRQQILLESLLRRGAADEFRKEFPKLGERLEKRPDRSASYQQAMLKGEELRARFATLEQREEDNLAALQAHLDRFHLLQKLRFACHQLQRRNARPAVAEELPVLRELAFLLQFHEKLVESDPVLEVYAKLFSLAATDSSDLAQWADFQRTMDGHATLLPKEEHKMLRLLAAYFLNHQVNRGAYATLAELRAAHDSLFEHWRGVADGLPDSAMLVEGDFAPFQRFANVFSAALNAGRGDWAEAFLDKRLHLLRDDKREAANNFCRAALHLHRRQLADARNLAAQVGRMGLFSYYEVKSLMLRIELEDGQPERFEQLFAAFLEKQRSEQTLTTHHLKGYRNFFVWLRTLSNWQNRPVAEREKPTVLKERIERAHPVAQKKWLLEWVERAGG